MCIEDSGGASEVPMAIRWSNSPSAHRHGSMPFLLVILRGELDGSQKKAVQALSVNPTILLVRLTWENFGVAGLKWGNTADAALYITRKFALPEYLEVRANFRV